MYLLVCGAVILVVIFFILRPDRISPHDSSHFNHDSQTTEAGWFSSITESALIRLINRFLYRIGVRHLEPILCTGCNRYDATVRLRPKGLCAPGAEPPDDREILLFLVLTRADHSERRAAIRSAWAQNGLLSAHYTTRTLFVLGMPDAREDWRTLVAEEANSDDLLLVSYRESFTNLTQITLAALHTVLHDCSGVAFVYKADDDTFVNTHRLLELLERHRHRSVPNFRLHRKYRRSAEAAAAPQTASARASGSQAAQDVLEPPDWERRFHGTELSHTILCHTLSYIEPHTDEGSKWELQRSEYSQSVLPAFCSGGVGYLLHMRALRSILSAAPHVPLIPLEDVFLTGLVPLALAHADRLRIAATDPRHQPPPPPQPPRRDRERDARARHPPLSQQSEALLDTQYAEPVALQHQSEFVLEKRELSECDYVNWLIATHRCCLPSRFPPPPPPLDYIRAHIHIYFLFE